MRHHRSCNYRLPLVRFSSIKLHAIASFGPSWVFRGILSFACQLQRFQPAATFREPLTCAIAMT
jgi:hypothetical protein